MRVAASRHQRVFLPVLAGLVTLAWLTLWLWARSPYGRYLDHGDWTASGPAAWLCRVVPAGSLVVPAALYALAWTLMILAMMLPTTLPLFRPLIGMDKEEITAEAVRLGTFPISIIPDQDCCTLFTPRNPQTKARLHEIEEAEAALDIDALVARAVEEAEVEDFEFPASQKRTLAAKAGPADAPV